MNLIHLRLQLQKDYHWQLLVNTDAPVEVNPPDNDIFAADIY